MPPLKKIRRPFFLPFLWLKQYPINRCDDKLQFTNMYLLMTFFSEEAKKMYQKKQLNGK